MTLSSTYHVVEYTVTAGQTTFPYGYYFLQPEDLVVVVVSDVGIETTQVYQTGYTVDGYGEDGGDVEFFTAPTTGYIVRITRVVDLLQDSTYIENDDLRAARLEEDFDRVYMTIQQVDEEVGRSIRVPIGSELSDENLEVSPMASRLIGFNSNATALTTYMSVDALETYTNSECGVYTLASGVKTASIAFTTVFDDTDYVVVATLEKNPSDDITVDNIYSKTTSGFSVELSEYTSNATTKINWLAMESGASYPLVKGEPGEDGEATNLYPYIIDATETNQSATGNGGTVYSYCSTIGTSSDAQLLFKHVSGAHTYYYFTSNYDLSSYTNLLLEIQNGAILSVASGVTITLPCPENIKANGTQQIFAGAGTVKFANAGTVYPEWFGAKGDGTTDDYSAICGMLNSSKTNGNTMVFGSNTYPISAQLTIDSTWLGALRFHGSGRGKTNVKSTFATNDKMFKITSGPDNIEFRDMTMECYEFPNGSGLPIPSSSISAITVASCDGLIIDNVEVKNCGCTAIATDYITNGVFNNLYIHDSISEGILVSTGSRNCTISNSSFDNNMTHIDTNGQSIAIVGNTLRNNVQLAAITVECTTGQTALGLEPKDIVISGNTIYAANDIGINVSGWDEASEIVKDVYITGNIIDVNPNNEASSGRGIHLQNCDGIHISGNLITNCQYSGGGNLYQNGIESDGYAITNVTIIGNTFRHTHREGIRLGNVTPGGTTGTATTSHVVIMGNAFQDNYIGLTFDSDVSDVTIAGNSFDTVTYGYNFNDNPSSCMFGINYFSNVVTLETLATIPTLPTTSKAIHLTKDGDLVLQQGTIYFHYRANGRLTCEGSQATGYVDLGGGGGTFTLDDTHSVVSVSNTADVNLPDADGCPGRIYTIKCTAGSITITIVPGGVGGDIDGAANYQLTAVNKYVTVVSSGVNKTWLVIANN
jgi:hypothetical protein